MKHFLIRHFLLLVCFVFTSACTQDIASSELNDTSAGALELNLTVTEFNENPTAIATLDMETIPDGVDVEFNEGQQLSLATSIEGEDISTNFSYEEDVIFGVISYVTALTKPETGDNYVFTYVDRDGEQTVIEFASQGVPEFSINTSSVSLNGSLTLTWDATGGSDMELVVRYPYQITNRDGSTRDSEKSNRFTVADTGSYTFTVTDAEFRNILSGTLELYLVRRTNINEANDFGSSNITVSSQSLTQEVEFLRN